MQGTTPLAGSPTHQAIAQVKLVIFDWDGTVMDSVPKIVRSLQIAAARCDVPVPPAHEAKQIIGLSLGPAMNVLFPGASQAVRDTLAEQYKHAYLHLDDTPTPFFTGAEPLFQTLKQRGYRLAVATGKARRGLDRVLHETATGHYFCATRCADEAESKPHPLMLQQLLQHFALTPEQAVMVGDSKYDLQMAQAIGMPRIGITHGVHGHAEFAALSPVAVVDDLPSLLAHLPGR